MKVAVISDIHDNLPNLRKVLDFCRAGSVAAMICCGDVTNSETIRIMAGGFAGDIHIVRGNCEIYEPDELEEWKNFHYYGQIGLFEIGGVKVGICHEPYFIGRLMEKSAPAMVFYGHTHRPWIEKRQGVQTVNPGTLSGLFQGSTFALWEPATGALELKIIDQLKNQA